MGFKKANLVKQTPISSLKLLHLGWWGGAMSFTFPTALDPVLLDNLRENFITAHP